MKTLIKEITHIQTGLFAKPSDKGEVVYLQSKHFDEYGQLHAVLYPDLMADGISEKHLLKDGDVLFAAKGNKNFAAVFENHNEPSVASTSFFVLRQTGNKVLPRYIAWFLNHTTTQNVLKEMARGTSIPSIRKSVLEDLEIVIPSLENQKIIVTLSELALKETEIRMKVLERRKQIIEQQIFNAIQ